MTLLPWQRAALIRMLELNEDGSLRFRTVVVLVARQNGKSTLAQILTIWLLCVWGWPLILGTAQDLDVAESLWEEVVDLVEENDELAEMVDKVVKVNGKKSLNLTTGSKYKVKAANRRAGRGLSGNLVLLDELREHQTWDAWGAITKTTMARAEAMILALSNAGDVTSRVLRYLRLMAHQAIGDPDGINAAEANDSAGPTQFDVEGILGDGQQGEGEGEDDDDGLEDLELDDMQQDSETLCLLEWSAPPGCDKRDRAGWAAANPSRGYTITDRTIAAACKTDPEWIFRTEVLCQWLDGATSGPFPPGAWEATTVEVERGPDGAERVPDEEKIVGPVVAGIGQSSDRSFAYVAVAGHRADGMPQAEVWAGRYGTDWVAEWLMERKGRVRAVTGQTRGAPESTLLKQLRDDPAFTIPVVDLQGSDLLDAHAVAFDAVRDKEVWHLPQPALDLPAQTAETKILGGGTWVLDAKASPVDVAPLKAWIAALWLLTNHDVEPPPPPAAPQSVSASARDDYDDGPDHDPESLTGDLSTAGF